MDNNTRLDPRFVVSSADKTDIQGRMEIDVDFWLLCGRAGAGGRRTIVFAGRRREAGHFLVKWPLFAFTLVCGVPVKHALRPVGLQSTDLHSSTSEKSME